MNPACIRLEKPWGWEFVWEVMPSVLSRVVHVTRGHRLWLESGETTEQIVLCCGLLMLMWDDDGGELHERALTPGQVHAIPVRTRHRMVAVEDADVVVVGPSATADVPRVDED